MAERKRQNETPVWIKELEDALECPVCCETLKPPIYLCENMHGVCSKCKTSLIQHRNKEGRCCPLCRGKMTEKRNFQLENVLEKLPFSVKCKHRNCDFKMTDKTLVQEHEAECQHRAVPCGICDDPIPLSDLTRHLEDDHDMPKLPEPPLAHSSCRCIRLGETFNIRVPKDMSLSSEVYPLNIKDDHPKFYLNETRLDNLMMVWVSCSLPAAKAEDYMYTITIDGSKSTFAGSRRCVPCDISHGEMKKSKKAVLFDEELVSEAQDNDYGLKISKC